jgi:23S rRNA G2445 N2-methylase RlmL
MMKRKVSLLNKTWIFDIDGTIVKHNGYKLDGYDSLLEGAAEFFAELPVGDMVVLITSREEECKAYTETFLSENGIRFDTVIYKAPYGERILVNDAKPSGLFTAIAVNTARDEFMRDRFEADPDL